MGRSEVKPPPRNLLRASSPGEVERLRSRALSRSARYARQTFQPREISDEDRALEAAVASGHRNEVASMLEEYDRLGLAFGNIGEALLSACCAGSREVIEEILRWIPREHLPLQKALCDAASHGHAAVLLLLLDNTDSIEARILNPQAILEASVEADAPTFQAILDLVQRKFTDQSVHPMMQSCLTVASRNDKSRIVEAIVDWYQDPQPTILFEAFVEACQSGSTSSATVLLEALRPNFIDPRGLSEGTRVAVERGHLDTVQYLLPYFMEQPMVEHLQRMILVAAGNGRKDLFELLWTQHNTCVPDDTDMIDRVMGISAMNGHHEICAHPLLIGVDVTSLLPSVQWSDISLHERDPRGQWKFRQPASSTEGLGLPTYPMRSSAIEYCLAGYQRIQNEENSKLRTPAYPTWIMGDRNAQDKTMLLLLRDLPSLKGPHWTDVICNAVALCTPDILALMFDKGADPHARHKGRTTFEIAADREICSYTMVKILIGRGGDVKQAKMVADNMLAQSLSCFPLYRETPSRQGRLLSKTNSLADLFNTGQGALISYLLSALLPSKRAIGDEYTVFLQCAAAAGQEDTVKLLIQRGVELNANGSYYGTALQAASRFGHLQVVKLLLEAGADANVVGGSHYTALRAAVTGGSLSVVQLLLANGANTEISIDSTYEHYNESSPTALQLAVTYNYVEIAMALISAGADCKIRRWNGETLLIEAYRGKNQALTIALLAASADIRASIPDHGDKDANNVVNVAIENKDLDMLRLLLPKSSDLTSEYEPHRNSLRFAASKGNLDALQILLDLMQPVPCDMLYDGLLAACQYSQVNVVEKLVELNGLTLDGEQKAKLLTSAAYQGHNKLLGMIIDVTSREGEPDSWTETLQSTSHGSAKAYETLLQFFSCPANMFVESCVRGYENVVRIALERGIGADTVDDKGRPAIHLAAANGSASTVDLLLRHGADANRPDPVYGLPLQVALEGYALLKFEAVDGSEEIEARAQLVFHYNESISYEYYFPSSSKRQEIVRETNVHEGNSALQIARLYEQTVAILLDHGARADVESSLLGSALTMAAFTGLHGIMNRLLRNGAKIDTLGGLLKSPLNAAVAGHHINVAKSVIRLDAHIDPEALFTACQNSDLSAVRLLLAQMKTPVMENGESRTPLRVCLERLNTSTRYEFHHHPSGWSHGEAIVALLLDHYPSLWISDDDLIAAAGISCENFCQHVLKKMLPRTTSRCIPEQAMIILLGNHSVLDQFRGEAAKQMLADKCIALVTTNMLKAASYNPMRSLLEYSPTYQITTDTITAIAEGPSPRECLELLFLQPGSPTPREQDIIAILKKHYSMTFRSANFDNPFRPNFHSTPEDGPNFHVLKKLFDSNLNLRATEEMLSVAADELDRNVLLGRMGSVDK